MKNVKDRTNVITAGPSAGKSSLCRELSAKGYKTLPEAARILFDQKISEEISPEEVRSNDDFHEQVEAIDRQIERHLGGNQVTWLDRSLADNIAYRRKFGNREGIFELRRDCKERYDNIFLLERIEFVDDEVREEDEQEAQELHQLLREAYENMSYDVIDVPLMPVDERAEFVEKEITKTPPIH